MNLLTAKFKCSLAVVSVVVLAGCSSIPGVDDRRVEYKKSRSEPALEVPPDLSASAIDDAMVIPEEATGGEATFSDYTRERSKPASVVTSGVLPPQDNIRVERDGKKRWLVIQGDPAQVWPKVREFWLDNGFVVKVEDPRIGIMETDWAENRADIPQDVIRSTLGKVLDFLYTAATRDKYRVRLERSPDAMTTELYLTHYGMEEAVTKTSTEGAVSTIWKPRPSDPELEVEMLNQMMAFLGVEEKKAKRLLARNAEREPRANLVRDEDGGAQLVVDEAFPRTWRLTGIALDQVGFTVEDRDRSKGIYFVRYKDPYGDKSKKKKGFLSRLAFWKGDSKFKEEAEYQVSLQDSGATTQVVVLDKEGKPEKSDTAARILTLLQERLK